MTETEQHQQTALPLAETVATRLAESALTDPVKALLRDALGSGTADAGTTTSSAASGRVYLDSLAVNGFRGIGPRARLSLSPRPGVNLVVGRNGSGKSSLAEAIEVGFTGTGSIGLARTRRAAATGTTSTTPTAPRSSSSSRSRATPATAPSSAPGRARSSAAPRPPSSARATEPSP